jgi:hypothetical protein
MLLGLRQSSRSFKRLFSHLILPIAPAMAQSQA